MDIPKRIHQIWLGPTVPEGILQYQATWRRHHPSWTYRLWRDDDFNWLENRTLFASAVQPAIKADIARMEILLREGGLYVDSDIECHRPIDDLLCGAELVLLNDGDLVTNSFLAATPGHAVIRRSVLRISQLGQESLGVPEWSALPETGPMLLTRAVVDMAAAFAPTTRVLPSEVASLPRSRAPEVVRLAADRRWMTHHAHASWRNHRSLSYRLRRTQLRTRLRRFLDLSAS